MPARPRLTKALKENECVTKTSKQNQRATGVKPSRKALADKTNSASDDNTSILTDQNPQEKLISKKSTQLKTEQNDFRPRRTRKLPSRYKENVTLTSLSNSMEISASKQPSKPATNTVSLKPKVCTVKTKISSDKISNSLKKKSTAISPLKTPNKQSDDSLVHNRPKRISRLPSKFDDQCISPNKPLSVQPINTSTPLTNKTKNDHKTQIVTISQAKTQQSKNVSKQNTIKNYFNNNSKTTADSNNNAKNTKKNKVSPKKSPVNICKTKPNTLKIITTSSDKNKSLKRDSSKLDIYEFTYDPKEEPPAKKKKKRTVPKKSSKPKTVTFKSNYDKNLAKALADLRNAMLEKAKSVNVKDKTNAIVLTSEKHNTDPGNKVPVNQNLDISDDYLSNKNYNSVRVEDIAMDMQENDINYSPVNSPSRPITPAHNTSKPKDINRELSFFDDHPVASSSMNASDPLASPWRVEFKNLPIKWPVNTYVKPNMTPAFESSFINFNDKKKHVYTNMLPESHDPLPEIVDSPSLKQTSIMSFIKEVIDKDSSRKKSKLTPVKANSLFEEADVSVAETPNKLSEINENVTPVKEASNLLKETTKNDSDLQNEKSNDTYFGFNQSEDQENVSPKKKNKARLLRTRSRGILQELNVQKGPMRVNIPISELKPIHNVVTKVLPQVPDKTDVTEPSLPQDFENDDMDSVHLFEDIEIVHHHKPTRKSYGKPKKVAFAKGSANSDSLLSNLNHASSDEDLDDSSFRLPSIKPTKAIKKKKTNKQKLSKKEEKEIETWAAGFNSMCEDVDQFDLLVE